MSRRGVLGGLLAAAGAVGIAASLAHATSAGPNRENALAPALRESWSQPFFGVPDANEPPRTPRRRTDWREDPGGGYVEMESGRTVPYAKTEAGREQQRQTFGRLKEEERAQQREDSLAGLHARGTANGEIAFARYRFTNSPLRREIWAAKPDGSGLRRLTQTPANELDASPSWAPDGSRLVFTRCPADESAPCAIWAVSADGSGQHRLSKACADPKSGSCVGDDGAVYSPDGSQLVFNRGSASGASIVVSNTQLRPLGTFPVPIATPDVGALAWSPDGRRIAFEARNDSQSAIFVVDASGRRLRRLTPWRLEAYGDDRIDWSPDARRILFHSVTSDDQGALPRDGDLYTIRPDGTGLRRLTHLPRGTGIETGSYSPDGKWIVFATRAGATPGPGSLWPDVFVLKADGTGLRAVTRSKNWESSPDWGRQR